MLDYLVRHALRNVWCSPYQDRQILLKLSRASAYNGVRNFIDLQWDREPMPTSGDRYHVFLIGQNTPHRLNLPTELGFWFKLSDLCEERDLIADIYSTGGLNFMRHTAYIKRTRNKKYIVAIRDQRRFARLDDQPVFLRLYSNAYYDSDRSHEADVRIRCQGKLIETPNAQLDLQWQFHQLRARPTGHAYAFVNGWLVDDFLPDQVAPGDYVEWVYDESIREIYEWRLADLKTFVSVLDNKQKYLLHPPKNLNTIDFDDDVDFWIIEKQANGRYKGLLIHQNQDSTIRMVTHHDYSLSSAVVGDYLEDNPQWQNNPNVYIRAHVRKSGYDRPLVDEHHRIKELYKLTDDEIYRAMIGIDSTIPEWRAARLESSNYTRIMRSYFKDITSAEVVQAYGYNATAKLTADTPLVVENETVQLPVGLQYDSTIYEFNAQGHLLDWRHHVGGEFYYTNHPNCAFIEAVTGIGGMDSNIAMSFGNAPVTLDPNQSYRFYLCPIISGVPNQEWIDVTGDTSKYQIVNGVVQWLVDPAGLMGAVKGNKHYISYDLTLAEHNHLYRISINHTPVQGTVLHIPPGRIDIWMNGKALIETIDYTVKYPEVIIRNKEYLEDGEQQFTIRCTGFANSDLSRDISKERGFVKHGTISLNSTYDIRDDKVMRCVVNGRTFLRDQLEFAEHQKGVEPQGIADGRPYMVEEVVPEVRGIVPFNTYVLRPESKEVDKRVSDYLTMKIPEPTWPNPPMIPERYEVYSPTCATILYDLWEGNREALPASATDAEVAEFMQPYLYLLDHDPTRDDNLDDRFVSIHPHPKYQVLTVTQRVYSFLDRIIRLYLRNRVDLSYFVDIEPGAD